MDQVSSFIPDDEENDNTPTSFIPDVKKDIFKPAPEALKVDNEEVDKLLREAHESLNKTTDWRNSGSENSKASSTEPKKEKKGFFQGVKDIPESIFNQVNKAGKSSFENIKKGNYPAAMHDITSLATDPFEGLTSAAINLSQGKKPIETTPEQAKEFALGVSGIPSDRILEAYRNQDYGRLAGQGLSAAALFALSHGAGKLGEQFSSAKAEELPIRSPKEIIPPESLHPSELPPDLVPVGSENLFNKPRQIDENIRADNEPPINYESKFKNASDKLAEIKGENPKYSEPKSFVPDESNPLSDYKPEERPILRSDASKMSPEQLSELNKFMDSTGNPNLEKMQEDIRSIPEGLKSEEPQITAKHIGTQPRMPASGNYPEMPAQHLYNIEGGPEHGFTVMEQGLKDRGIEVPELNKNLEGKTGTQLREEALASKASESKKFVNPFEKSSEEVNSFVPDNELKPEENKTSIEEPKSFTPDENEAIIEMHGGPGGGKKVYPPSQGPAGTALDKLFNSMGSIKENLVKQEMINKTERARRFAAFEGVKDTGRVGAAKALGTLKGDFEAVDNDKLQLGRNETNSLFTAVKSANITTGEKIRGYISLFKLLNGKSLQRNEIQVLDNVFGNNFGERITEMHGGLGAVGLKISKLANTMKAMKSSLDLSAPLRQGIGLIHRPEYRQAFKEQFKYYGNKEYYNEAMNAIQEDPGFIKSREAGLFLSKHNDLTNSEEAFANNYIGEIPKISGIPGLVDASERAYTGFLNTLRFQTFKNLVKNAETSGNQVFEDKKLTDGRGNFLLDENGNVKTSKIPTKTAENIAKYINVSTGRGGLGRLEKIAPELNTVLWSPRLISSRLSVLNPKYYIDLDPFTRKEAIKSLFAIAASGITVASLAKQAGAKVSTDPTSADFGKARFGNNVLDPYAGFQQPIVAAARMISEVNRMASGKPKVYGKPNIPEIAGNFLANKESPIVSLAHEVATAQKFTGGGNYISKYGQKKNITPEIANSFTPMFFQDVYDVFKNDPSFGEQIGLDTASLFGMGVQNYAESGGSKPLAFRKMSTR